MAKRFSWSEDHEMVLIKQLINDQPFRKPYAQRGMAWDELAASVKAELLEMNLCNKGQVISGRGCRDKAKQLVDGWRKSERASARASGAAEDFTEKEKALTDLLELLDDVSDEKTAVKNNADESVDQELKLEGFTTMKRKSTNGNKEERQSKKSKTTTFQEKSYEFLLKSHEQDHEIMRQIAETQKELLNLKRLQLEAMLKKNN